MPGRTASVDGGPRPPPKTSVPRVVIRRVTPEVAEGRYPAKRILGDTVVVEADIFSAEFELLAGVLQVRKEEDSDWAEIPLKALGDDRWRAAFPAEELGRFWYTLQAWVDPFRTWQRNLRKRMDAGQDVAMDLRVGAKLIQSIAARAPPRDATRLEGYARLLEGRDDVAQRSSVALGDDLSCLAAAYPDRSLGTRYDRVLAVVVDRPEARFSSWYEMFPRSCSPQPGRHGTFRDCEGRLAYIASMGFDVVYLPPIHPIGATHRKGRDNATAATEEDPGSPWAIGSAEGGHHAVHPELGTLADFHAFQDRARDHGLEVALDLAFQCSPDHPYVREHPEWFLWRPDGTIQHAENPPKRYEDIFPLEFATPGWRELWEELRSIVLFWIQEGVRTFRVDNPHTKPFAFWEWLIDSVKEAHPDVIFLSEAFTRPKIMHHLARVGFSQSYTYFTWCNTKSELTDYFTELATTEVREYFRPHLWPNTPDILTEYLQSGGRPAFMIRLVLAATLGAGYGIYGPAFELCEDRARDPGGEEYLDSEKYEIRIWDLDRPESLRKFIATVNRARKENPALQSDERLRFHPVDNEQLLCYTKMTEDGQNLILVVVNLDPHHTQSGWVQLSLEDLGIDPKEPFQVHDLLSEARYLWHGARNYVELDPQVVPAHLFRVRRRLRREDEHARDT